MGIAFLVLSSVLLVGVLSLLVSLKRGEGPVYGASRHYDANRREAVRVLLGESVDSISTDQWFLRARKQPVEDDPLADSYRAAVTEALKVVVPNDRQLEIDDTGVAHLKAEDTWVVPAISTADLRALDIGSWDDRGRLTVGLVLLNPEPPGGDAKRVALPAQVIFPALQDAGRTDLVRRFEEIKEATERA